MIIHYSAKYKEDVLNMLSDCSGNYYTCETYIFNTFGYAFGESSFLFIKGGKAVGFIGVICSCKNKSLHVYSLCTDKLYRTDNIGTMLIEKVILYANKNKYKTISFTLNNSNRRIYPLFSSLAKRLNKQIKKTNRYEEATFLEITYTIYLENPEQSENRETEEIY